VRIASVFIHPQVTRTWYCLGVLFGSGQTSGLGRRYLKTQALPIPTVLPKHRSGFGDGQEATTYHTWGEWKSNEIHLLYWLFEVFTSILTHRHVLLCLIWQIKIERRFCVAGRKCCSQISWSSNRGACQHVWPGLWFIFHLDVFEESTYLEVS
jgi:hypothetical protein